MTISIDQQFTIWEPEEYPQVWMRCNICKKAKQIAWAPLYGKDEISPVATFMARHEHCFYAQADAEESLNTVMPKSALTAKEF